MATEAGGWRIKIRITNKPLYDFLRDYSYKALLEDGIMVANFSKLKNDPAKELSFEYDDDYYVDCQPESLSDVAICLLIFLGLELGWTVDRFQAFKKAYLKKIATFEIHFEKVYWET